MKEHVIKALAFPRDLMRQNLELEGCAHNGDYAKDDVNCLLCKDTQECDWLSHNDEYVALAQKPMETLVTDLEFALDFVRAQVAYWYHEPKKCTCSACQWVGQAQLLYDDYLKEKSLPA